MKISVKSKSDIAKMRVAGKLAAEVLEMISPHVVPGISTGELDEICFNHIVNVQKAIPANVGYNGYEKTICASLNQVICHGIPSNEKVLKSGDILNIDVTVVKDGWHGDTSKMFLVGKCAPHNERLVRVTQECLYKGIEVVKPGAFLVILDTQFKRMLKKIITALLKIIVVMELVLFTMKSRKFCITEKPVQE